MKTETLHNKDLKEENTSLKEELDFFQQENLYLKEKIKLLTQRKFGKKSEKCDPNSPVQRKRPIVADYI